MRYLIHLNLSVQCETDKVSILFHTKGSPIIHVLSVNTGSLVSSWFSSDFLPLELKNNLPEVSQIFKEAQIVDYTITEEETVPGSGEVCASDVHR